MPKAEVTGEYLNRSLWVLVEADCRSLLLSAIPFGPVQYVLKPEQHASTGPRITQSESRLQSGMIKGPRSGELGEGAKCGIVEDRQIQPK